MTGPQVVRTRSDGSAEAGDLADVAVVFVHGIGRQARTDTLLGFAEPLVVWLRDRVGPDGAVEVVDASLGAGPSDDAPSHATITVRPAAGIETRWCLMESHWAESFPPPTPATMFGWAGRFSRRAARRVLSHLLRPVDVVLTRFLQGSGAAKKAALAAEDQPVGYAGGVAFLQIAVLLVAAVVLIFTYLGIPLAVYVITLLVGTFLAVLAVNVFAALMALAVRLPYVSGKVSGLATSLATSVGDTYAFLRQPIRAAAMAATITRDLAWARRRAPKVVVVAHSQGAALMARLLIDDVSQVDELITVGGAVALLSEVNPTPVAALLGRSHPVKWTNLWSTWDPVSAGPVHDPSAKGGDRWLELYGVNSDASPTAQAGPTPAAVEPVTEISDVEVDVTKAPPPTAAQQFIGAGAAGVGEAYKQMGLVAAKLLPDPGEDAFTLVPGPAEIAVHNRASLVRDHIAYSGNDIQVIRRIADAAAGHVGYGDNWSAADDASHMNRVERRHVTAVRLLGASRLVNAVAAVSATATIWLAHLDDPIFDVASMGASIFGLDLPQWRARVPSAGLADFAWLVLIGIVVFAVINGATSTAWGLWYRAHVRQAAFTARQAWGWRLLVLLLPMAFATTLTAWGTRAVLIQVEDPDATNWAWISVATMSVILLWSMAGFRPKPTPARIPPDTDEQRRSALSARLALALRELLSRQHDVPAAPNERDAVT